MAKMESSEIKKYANTIHSMTTDYLMGNYDEELYKSMIKIISKNINDEI